MKKYIIISLLVFLVPTLSFATGSVSGVATPAAVNSVTPSTVNGVNVADASGVSWDLMDEGFEGSDGTNLHGFNSWSGDDVDNLEIDTAQYVSGSSSALASNTSTSYVVEKAMTEQTSGIFCAEFQYRTNNVGSNTYSDVLTISDGAWVSNTSTNNAVSIRKNVTALEYRATSGSWVSFQTVSANTWYKLAFCVDLDSNDMDIYVNESSVATSVATYNVSPDNVAVVSYRLVIDHSNWIDDLRITTSDTIY